MKTKREQAIEYLGNKRYSDALPLFLDLVEDDSNDSMLFYMIGQCYRFTNNIQNAIKFLKKSYELNPNDANITLALGIGYQLIEEYEKAISFFMKAIKLDDNLTPAYNSLGLTYRKMNNIPYALECYFAALEKRVDLAENRASQKITMEEQEEYEKLNKVEIEYGVMYPVKGMDNDLLSDPEYAIISNNIGACYFQAEEYGDAQRWFINAIESTPKEYEYSDPHQYLEEMRERNIPFSFA